MKIRRIVLSIFAVAAFSTVALADSPLTSTKFSDAYMDEPIVVAAGKTNGIIDNQLMEFLASEYNPIDVKMAVINKLGWKIDGKNNSKMYFDFLKSRFNYKNQKRFMKKGRADHLLSYAYLKAMDNYFKVDEALKFAERAVKKESGSRTFRLIHGLIKAQKTMDSDWCQVYQITDGVRKNRRLMNDMRTRSVGIIYNYMDIYGDSCKG